MRGITCMIAAALLGIGMLNLRVTAAQGMDMPGMNMPGMTMPATTTAPAPTGPAPTVTVAAQSEEGKKMLVATVKLNGKAVEGAKVGFFVKRTFGLLTIGQDDTLDDGTAAVPYPEGLAGGMTGQLEVVARVLSPAQYSAGAGQITVAADTIVEPDPDPFPRAIWSPNAPLPLVVTLATLLGGVWCTYAFVVSRLWGIRRQARQPAPETGNLT